MTKTEIKKALAELTKTDEAFAVFIEKLIESETALKTEAKTAEKTISEQKAKMDELAATISAHLEEIHSQKETIAGLNKLTTNLTDQGADLEDQIKDLEARLDKRPKNLKLVEGTAKVGGKTFRFKEGFVKTRYKGQVVASADLLEDKEAMEYLVKIGYGGLEEVK
jgi:chromosome segregation ATPase